MCDKIKILYYERAASHASFGIPTFQCILFKIPPCILDQIPEVSNQELFQVIVNETASSLVETVAWVLPVGTMSV